MRLLKVTLAGYRRFEEPTSINVEDRLVAIVGRNESGKSSLLTALTRFNDTDAFDLQRDQPRKSAAKPEIKAQFALDPFEIELLKDIPGGAAVRWVYLTKKTSGGITWTLDEYPHRDRSPRREGSVQIAKLAGDPALDAPYADQAQPWDPDRYNRVLEYLQSTDETLTPEVISEVEQLAASLNSLSYPDEPDPDENGIVDQEEVRLRAERAEGRAEVADHLTSLVAHERETHPGSRVRTALEPLVPKFLLFDDAARNLHRSYDLNTLPDPPPVALQNVAALAQLDLDDLRRQLLSGNRPEADFQLEKANEALKADFKHSWGQSDVYVRLALDGSVLELYVSVEGGNTYSWIDERSDGLRTFVALRAFVAGYQIPKPILLIDEAETHLHYDAQVDLIEVLARQELAAKVIYTTHSVGCLPPDLGSGIRAVVPITGQERSKIDNSFWTSGPGFTPLLFGMGASLLALAIPRRVVLTEGASDCVVIPTLIRQVAELNDLDFRFAPGLSSASDATLRELDTQGGRVAFLVDGDNGGSHIRKRLERAGVIADHIISLGDLSGAPVTVEDLVDSDVLAGAVNDLLHRWRAISDDIAAIDFGDTDRWAKCEEWCAQHEAVPPSKLQLAQEIVDRRDSGSASSKVFDDVRRDSLIELLARIRSILDNKTLVN